MSGKTDKKARKILRQELREKLIEERVEIMPQVKILKEATLNLKPCFEIFGLTFFKTRDVISFYDTLKNWVGERPKRVARKNLWQVFKKLTSKPGKADNETAAGMVPRETSEEESAGTAPVLASE